MIDLKKKGPEPISDIASKINLRKEPLPVPDAKNSGTGTSRTAKKPRSTPNSKNSGTGTSRTAKKPRSTSNSKNSGTGTSRTARKPRSTPISKNSGTGTPGTNPGNSTNQAGSSQPQSGSNDAKDAWSGCFGYCGCLGVLALFSVCLRSGFKGLILGVAILLGVCWIGAAIRKHLAKK